LFFSCQGCSIITSGGQQIGEMLKTNSSIKVLNLENNKIKTDGIQAIAKGIKYNTTLEELGRFFLPLVFPSYVVCNAFL